MGGSGRQGGPARTVRGAPHRTGEIPRGSGDMADGAGWAGHRGLATCRFASGHINTLLEKVVIEIDGVRRGDDIEHIHRMRVASRRLRAGLRTFRDCLPEKKFRWIYAETRGITRALGEARDADVQIAFLKKIRKVPARSAAGDGGEGDMGLPLREAVRFLLGRLRRQRAGYQVHVIGALERFGKKDIPGSIVETFVLVYPPGRIAGWYPSTLPLLAAEQIGRCYGDLMMYEPWLQYPDAIAEHHAMRIAAKNLRYTMEIFAPVYRLGLRKYIARIARLQKVLGELHDTDVWIDMVSAMLLKERSRPRVPDDTNRPGPIVIAGLKVFLHDREKERRRIYRQLVRYWELLRRTQFWESLIRDVHSSQRVMYTRGIALSEEEKKDAVARAMQIYHEGIPHARHVAGLALQLFDQLQGDHRLGAKERSLLEYAALLHDIGWRWGKKGHAGTGSHLVRTMELLPFSMDERGAISLLVQSHRGRDRLGKSGYFHLLPEQERHAIAMLAGIMRVADGLDGAHRGTVKALACRVTPDEVSIAVGASPGCSHEISMALAKADVFIRAFGKAISIVQAAPALDPPAMAGECPDPPGDHPDFRDGEARGDPGPV